jgi:hypothetical protein
MANKKCLVFETLGNIRDLELIKESNDGFMRLHGVFGVCGVKNNNNRVYNKKNYGMMVEALQREITEGSVLGELEHPTSMNIDLNKVSHKIESIEMNEDGTITGTIVLLDTAKGRDAQAIAKAAGSLYISSRGAGSIDESGNVNLTTIKTYDLVGTPGFSQAKLNLKKGQTLESLNESLEDGNIMYAIIDESSDADDLLADDNNKKEDDKKSDDKKSEENKSDDNSSDDKDDKKEDKPSDNDKDNNKKNDKEDATMNDLKEAIDKLGEKIESLQADLHVAQESLTQKDNEIKALHEQLDNIPSINYGAIEQWVTDEFAPNFKESLKDEIMESVNESIEESVNDMTETIAEGVQNWTINEFAPLVEGYMVNEFAPVIEGYITEEFAPVIEGYITEEFAPAIEGWVNEEFAPAIEGWVNEELVPTIDAWVNEECIPEHKANIINEVNNNVSEFFESQNVDKLTAIDNLLEAIENKGADNAAFELLNETKQNEKYAGVYVVENMPTEYQPQWEMCSESKQREIITRSRMYDFTKAGILEKFWSTVDFTEAKPVNEALAPESNYHNSIAIQMRRLMKH